MKFLTQLPYNGVPNPDEEWFAEEIILGVGVEVVLYLFPSLIIFLGYLATKVSRSGRDREFHKRCRLLLLPVTLVGCSITVNPIFFLVVEFVGQLALTSWAIWLAKR